jgi:hypothetical protein
MDSEHKRCFRTSRGGVKQGQYSSYLSLIQDVNGFIENCRKVVTTSIGSAACVFEMLLVVSAICRNALFVIYSGPA